MLFSTLALCVVTDRGIISQRSMEPPELSVQEIIVRDRDSARQRDFVCRKEEQVRQHKARHGTAAHY